MDPSSVLPVELLSKIFHHYLTDREIPVQSFDFSDGLWVLGKVSSAWRSTANSSKSLWSTIIITKVFPTRDTRKDIPPLSNPRVLSRKNATERRKQILTEILSRSGDYPLIISISFPLYMQHREVVPTSDYWPLCTILAAHSHRWQAMELEGHPYLLNDFIFTPSFRLQSLRKLHAMVRDKAVLGQVARLCPGLVELVTGVSQGEYTLVRIKMPALERLEVLGNTHALDCVSAPNLKLLKIKSDSFANIRSDHNRSPVLEFLRHSKCSVRTLDINWRGAHDDLVAILSLTPSLESLECRVPFTRAFLAELKSPSSLIPSLHTLTLRFHYIIRFPHVKFILRMVESRLAGGILKSVRILPVGRTSIKMFDEQLAVINAPPDVTVWLEDNSGSPTDLLFPPFAGEDYDGDIYMRQVYSGLVTEDDLP
ncbi:hypothetical protein ARMGADRAFT_1063930, partial [Armillaria gallica]